MKDNDWKSRLGVVFSTNPQFEYNDDSADEEIETLQPAQQKLRVRIEKNHRAGKVVTIVSGFVGTDDDMKALGKMLKTRCGTGGSVKDGEILVQGDFRDRVIDILRTAGYTNSK